LPTRPGSHFYIEVLPSTCISELQILKQTQLNMKAHIYGIITPKEVYTKEKVKSFGPLKELMCVKNLFL